MAPRFARYGVVLSAWAIAGLTFVAVGDILVFLFVFLWPWNLILGAVWVIAGPWAMVGGLIEARHRRSWRFGLTFALLPILVLIGMASIWRATMGHPTDAAMIREFGKHRAEYEQLIALYRSDTQLGRIAPGFTRRANFFSDDSLPPGDPPSAVWLDDVRQRCRQLHLTDGIEGYGDKHQVDFIRSSRGLSISGSSKGFMWAVDPPALIVPDTDRYRPADGRSYIAYRRIEGHWYLFYDVED